VLASEPPGDLRHVKLSAARNEWVSLQILVRAGVPIAGMRVEAGELSGPRRSSVGRDTGASLSWSINSSGQRHLSEHGLQTGLVSGPVDPMRTSADRPESRRRPIQGGSFDLPAHETHAFWIDLHVSTNAVAGEYRGTWRVRTDRGQVDKITANLTVWDFTLPAVPALETEFGSPAARLRAYDRQRAADGKDAEPRDWHRWKPNAPNCSPNID